MTTRLRVLLAAVVAASSLTIVPSVTVAECQPMSGQDDISNYVGVAFIANVVEVTDEVDAPMPDAAPFDWKVVLDVDRVFRGEVEDTLHWNGWKNGCSGIRPYMFQPGHRLFISTAQLDPEGMRAPSPYTLVWRKLHKDRYGGAYGEDRWPFHSRVLKAKYSGFPSEARTSSKLRRIRKAVEANDDGWHEPLPRPERATDALGDRPTAIEVNDPPGGGWVDATGAEVDGPAYLDVTQMRVLVEDDRLVTLFRTDHGPTDVPPDQDLRYSLFVDTDSDQEAEVELRTYADGDAWAAAMYRLDEQGNPLLPAYDLDPVVNEYGVGTRVDLDVLGRLQDLVFLGRAASEGVFDPIPDDPDAWLAICYPGQPPASCQGER